MLSDYASEHGRPRRDSPAPPSKPCDQKVPRLDQQKSLSQEHAPVPSGLGHYRAETLPEKLCEPENPSMVTPQHIVTLLESRSDEILVLDLRVITEYSQSHIVGSLNLCVPTTLLKRPSYTVSKLADTFKVQQQRTKFENWRSCKYIIVYDSNTTQLKEAINCVNVIKKFEADGWTQDSCIIRGGFAEFSRKFPQYVDKCPESNRKRTIPSLTTKQDDPSLAPVIGGCPMPATKDAANPFFGNIRQNMDLIGGVGQMPVKLPASLIKTQRGQLPIWLQKASDEGDEGKICSHKFFHIEKREQKRMQEALSGHVSYGSPGQDTSKKVQIAGIEKGAKNRYNNIWPFEHSRVRLEGVSKEDCDYFNANYVATSLSAKNYIAGQAPIPATFSDFWSVVWQADVRVIVMLTAESEGGQVKAHNYWKDRKYGQLQVQFLSEHRASLEPGKMGKNRERPASDRRSSNISASAASPHASLDGKASKASNADPSKSLSSEAPFVTVRKFTVSRNDKPFERMREVTQLQYSSWPDFGAPANATDLLGLVQQCDSVVAASAGGQASLERPVLVHCSAGCGRTGTFCTVDSVLDTMRKQKEARSMSKASRASPMDMDATAEKSFFPPNGDSKSKNDDDWLQKDDMDLIEETVEQLRLQRLSMVQSIRQFVLCYETVLEWWVRQDQATTAS